MGHAYAHLPGRVRRVFLLGPTHHVYLDHCVLTTATQLSVPTGTFEVDAEVQEELLRSGKFTQWALDDDEAEHSIEMHLPMLSRATTGRNVKVVPWVVGDLSPKQHREYGEILAEYMADPGTVVAISTDFCHWGPRFRYQPYDESKGPVHKSIEAMDREGMEAIASGRADTFRQYISRTKNTICGKHPLCILLEALEHRRERVSVQWLHYSQSGAATSMRDSSVSYAAGVVARA